MVDQSAVEEEGGSGPKIKTGEGGLTMMERFNTKSKFQVGLLGVETF